MTLLKKKKLFKVTSQFLNHLNLESNLKNIQTIATYHELINQNKTLAQI